MNEAELKNLAHKILNALTQKDYSHIIFDFNAAAIRKAVSVSNATTSLLAYIALQIKTRRLTKNLSQLALAQRLRIHASQVSRHERGQQLTIDILPLYADALDCSVQDLLPPIGKQETIEKKCDPRIKKILDMFPEILELPDEQRNQVFDIVESTLKLAISKIQ